jgi:hypothetical protein|tara:strand:+ start:99 stop:419 length:321 start_codon:yes stop_codon:yes gene_type:complete
MSKEQYLRMCEQTGQEIDWERCPPEMEDFPSSVHTAIAIFNSLGERVYGDVGYTGKDYTNLNVFFDLYQIDHDKDWIMELILFLESRTIEESQKQLKAEINKMKNK